jgi:hypothetical protein
MRAAIDVLCVVMAFARRSVSLTLPIGRGAPVRGSKRQLAGDSIKKPFSSRQRPDGEGNSAR